MDASRNGNSVSAAEISSWVVLAVDDEADNLTLVTKVLTFKGAQVHTATNGQEALDMLKTLQPSLILLDLSMPVMDGWEMFKQLRANPGLQRVPVIALTAHAMVGDKERILAAGFDGYISKPFRLNTFLAEIMRCLGYDRHQQMK